MAAGPITLDFIVAGGETRTGVFWSSDGSETGNLTPLAIIGGPGQDALADFGEGAKGANTLRVGLSDDDVAALTEGLALDSSVQQVVTALAPPSTSAPVGQDTSVLYNGVTALTPKFAPISSTGSGDTVSAVTGKKIRVVGMFLVLAAASTVKFQSGNATDKTGAMSFAANGGIVLPFNPAGYFETASGEKLNHVLGTSVGFAGGITYVEV